MKKKIAKNRYYDISIDVEKNRGYTTFYGLWQEKSKVPDFFDYQMKAIQDLSPGFTVLADARGMKTPAREVDDLHVEMLKFMDKSGLKRLALVIDRDFLKISGSRIMRDSGVIERMKFFEDVDEAEEWLDG
jgi:hypothetical protein